MSKNRDLGEGSAPDTKQPVPSGNRYLFAVGIDQYHHFRKLSNAVKDAKDFIDVLTQRYGFSKEKVFLFTLFDDQANKENIYSVFEELIGKVRENDSLVIYYSGHGHYIPSTDLGYWIPVEAKPGKTVQYLDNLNIINFIRSIKSKHTLLISDSCFSGSLFASHRSAFIERISSLRSRWGIVSGRMEVVADGTPGQNSPFSNYLLKFLRENKEPAIAISTLAERIKVAVANNSQQLPQANPLRDVGDEGGEMVLYLDGKEPEVETPVATRTQASHPESSAGRSADPSPSPPEVKADAQNFRQVIKQFLAQSELGKAVEVMIKFMPDHHTAILLAGQWNRLQREKISGTIDDNRFELRSNQISNAILSFLG